MLRDAERAKLELMTSGMHVTAEAAARLSDGGVRPLTLADYASTSGVAMRLGDDVWVNAPIAEHNPNFVADPKCALDVKDGGYVLRWRELELPAAPVPVPDYHRQRNLRGEPYTSYAYTHTDRVRISPVEGCALTCQFCDLPYEYAYRTKPIDAQIDAIRVALRDPALAARHVLISGGTPREEDHGYLIETYEQVLAELPGIPVDVMMVPMPGLLDAEHLARIGVNQLSINIELFNEELARRWMPRKARVGRRAYLDFIARAAACFGDRGVRSLLLVGLEPMEDTLAGVRALAERGCDPVLSPFRPDPSTPLRGLPPPTVDALTEVYLRARDITESLGSKLGPRCIPCMHNTLTFPDGSGFYYDHEHDIGAATSASR